jgi:hypothetical protein
MCIRDCVLKWIGEAVRHAWVAKSKFSSMQARVLMLIQAKQKTGYYYFRGG